MAKPLAIGLSQSIEASPLRQGPVRQNHVLRVGPIWREAPRMISLQDETPSSGAGR